jgi:hypothetical protein
MWAGQARRIEFKPALVVDGQYPLAVDLLQACRWSNGLQILPVQEWQADLFKRLGDR